MSDKTIAAIATPVGTGGIGIVRISGTDAFKIAERMFRARDDIIFSKSAGYTSMLGRIFDDSGDVDEAIAFIYRAPRSYTGEDVVELSCHGGIWLIQRVLRLCYKNGAEPAEPGEFTKRAFLNGKIDLLQAEAIMDLISAKGEAAGKAALLTRDGALSRSITSIIDKLAAKSAHLSACADYPDEDIEPVNIKDLITELETITANIDKLLETYEKGQIIHEGIRTVIAGKPNVGKSTIMNLLSGRERSIVTDVPGTTRDIIEDTVRIDDIVLRLYDTAGIRDTADKIESIGVGKTKDILETANLILAVFDGSDHLSDWDSEFLELLRNKTAIAVINKTDLPEVMDRQIITEYFSETVFLSAETGEGRHKLENAIRKAVGLHDFDLSVPIVSSERQRLSLQNAREAIMGAIESLNSGVTLDAVNVDIDYALDALLTLKGEKVSERVLDEVFNRFCVGK